MSHIQVMKKTDKQPAAVSWLGGVEKGTNRETVYDADFEVEWNRFPLRHPDFSWHTFSAKVRHAFMKLQASWASKDFEKARPFETDALFDQHRFWIERYRMEFQAHGQPLQRRKVQALCSLLKAFKAEGLEFDADHLKRSVELALIGMGGGAIPRPFPF